MARKYKNKVVIELTTSKPLNEDDAVRAMRLLLSELDIEAKPIWANDLNIYATNFVAKGFNRVVNGLRGFKNVD